MIKGWCKSGMKKINDVFADLRSVNVGDNNENEINFHNKKYVEEIFARLESGLSDTFDRELVFAGAQRRKLNTPATETVEGSLKGVWSGCVFILNNDYVPEKYNSAGNTVSQIKEELFKSYGIRVDGIPYVNGIADFSSISLANISTVDIVLRVTGMSRQEYDTLDPKNRAHLFQKVFSNVVDGKSKRENNFDHADQIASEKQIPIPGLHKGYSAAELKNWRIKNKFSWDEQVSSGYNLVPAIIHGNLSHTGLVSTAKSAYLFLTYHERDMKNYPEKYCWDEDDAPITISEIQNYGRIINNKLKGEKNMAMRKVYSKGMNLGRHGEVGYAEINNETSEYIAEGERLHELGTQFVVDKTKLEDAIKKVQISNIPAEDKIQMIAELNVAIETLQEQYEADVVAEQLKVQEEIEGMLEQMDEAVDELEQQTDFLRGVTVEVADTDASATADIAEAKKQKFEQMKEEYAEKLRLQMEQAEIQQRNIRARQLSGR